jgi:hypothetical protein
MKIKALALAVLATAIFYSCENDQLESVEEATPVVDVNLIAFIAAQDLDNTPKGKYVGVIGHATNPAIHGKIFINSGQHNQYNALVQMNNGSSLKFHGKPQNRNASQVYFEGVAGSFIANFEEFEKPVLASVQFNEESDDGYIMVQKSAKGVDAFVITGTYVDENNPAFNGNWNIMGDGTVTNVPVTIGPPAVPFPVTLQIPTENIGVLTVTHSGSTTPLVDTVFEPNATLACIADGFPEASLPTVPFIIPTDIPNPIPFSEPLGGAGSLSSGGQTSLFNGSNASWSLSFATPIPAAMVDGGYTDDSCMASTSGSWSWNGRSGTITIVN